MGESDTKRSANREIKEIFRGWVGREGKWFAENERWSLEGMGNSSPDVRREQVPPELPLGRRE
jgi:hypothetical protein